MLFLWQHTHTHDARKLLQSMTTLHTYHSRCQEFNEIPATRFRGFFPLCFSSFYQLRFLSHRILQVYMTQWLFPPAFLTVWYVECREIAEFLLVIHEQHLSRGRLRAPAVFAHRGKQMRLTQGSPAPPAGRGWSSSSAQQSKHNTRAVRWRNMVALHHPLLCLRDGNAELSWTVMDWKVAWI